MEKCNITTAHILLILKEGFCSPTANGKKGLSNQVNSTYHLQIIPSEKFLKDMR